MLPLSATPLTARAVRPPLGAFGMLCLRIALSLILFHTVPAVRAAESSFLLGIDYTQPLPPNVRKLATDASGAIYLLSNADNSGQNAPLSTVTKLSADGQSILWRNQLAIPVSTMAVDPNGGVYVTPIRANAPDIAVAKLKDTGSGIAWTLSTGITFPEGADPVLAADASGRVYVAGLGTFFRIAAGGASIDYQQSLMGLMTSIVVNASGAAFVAGGYISDGILARFAPDGTPGYYTTFPDSQVHPTVALDPAGNPVVFSRGILSRFDANGALISSTTPLANAYSGVGNAYPGMAMDQAGNVYLMGDASGTPGNRLGSPLYANLPVRNSLAACGSEYLTVIAPDGALLQSTYLPVGAYDTAPFIALGKNGNVLIAAGPTSSFQPSRKGPFPAGDADTAGALLSLSATAPADLYPLACIGSGAGYRAQPVSPGQLVTLFGNGLGPPQGVAPQATLQTPYPIDAGEVQVTFGGTPAPILWAQDRQVNVVAPWSLKTGTNTEVCVSYQSVRLKCLNWPTAQSAPSVFTVDSSADPAPARFGSPQYAVALNQDGSVNSAANPAESGSLVSIFATGLGPISPPQPDGTLINLPLPVNSIPVTAVGSFFIPRAPFLYLPAEVTYAGPAPYMPAGVSQINFRLLPRTPDSYQIKLPTTTSPPILIHVR